MIALTISGLLDQVFNQNLSSTKLRNNCGLVVECTTLDSKVGDYFPCWVEIEVISILWFHLIWRAFNFGVLLSQAILGCFNFVVFIPSV